MLELPILIMLAFIMEGVDNSLGGGIKNEKTVG